MGVGIAAAAAARAEGLSSEEQATRAGEAGFRLLPMNSGDVLLHCYITSHYGFSMGFPPWFSLGQREAAAAAAVAAGLSPMEVVKAAGHAASAAMKALGMTAVEQAGTMVRTKCHGAMVPWCHGGIIILL